MIGFYAAKRHSNLKMLLLDHEAYVKPFLANAPILYPLKTPENIWFSGVFRASKMRTLVRNGLIYVYFSALTWAVGDCDVMSFM